MQEIKDKSESRAEGYNVLAERAVPAHPGRVHRAPTTTGLNVRDLLTIEERAALNATYSNMGK